MSGERFGSDKMKPGEALAAAVLGIDGVHTPLSLTKLRTAFLDHEIHKIQKKKKPLMLEWRRMKMLELAEGVSSSSRGRGEDHSPSKKNKKLTPIEVAEGKLLELNEELKVLQSARVDAVAISTEMGKWAARAEKELLERTEKQNRSAASRPRSPQWSRILENLLLAVVLIVSFSLAWRSYHAQGGSEHEEQSPVVFGQNNKVGGHEIDVEDHAAPDPTMTSTRNPGDYSTTPITSGTTSILKFCSALQGLLVEKPSVVFYLCLYVILPLSALHSFSATAVLWAVVDIGVPVFLGVAMYLLSYTATW